MISPGFPAAPALGIAGYEDAVRHLASSFRRGQRIVMRRTIASLALAKGSPLQATEPLCSTFLQ